MVGPLTMAEPCVEVAVDVTFMRMGAPPAGPPVALPEGVLIETVARCSVPFYRYLYDTVGGPWLWWMRRAASDAEIAAIMAHRQIGVHVMYAGGEPLGFYEIDWRATGATNLAYFGLMPWAIGKGVGSVFLRHAVDAAWAHGRPALTVNTCTADHPRALPAYLAAGFRVTRTVRETWPVPIRLGMRIPDHLRIG